MEIATDRKTVRKQHIDDGSTAGKTVYIDNYGDCYTKRSSALGLSTLGTNESVFTLDSKGNMFLTTE